MKAYVTKFDYDTLCFNFLSLSLFILKLLVVLASHNRIYTENINVLFTIY